MTQNTITMSRRQFLSLSLLSMAGVGLSGGKFAYDLISKKEEDIKKFKIYNELPKQVYLAEKTSTFYNKNKKPLELKKVGHGIILENKFLTMAHIFESEEQEPEEKKKLETKPDKIEINLLGHNLEKFVINPKEDVAIYSFPKGIKLKNFLCKPSDKISLGDEVYIIGNPNVQGFNVRKCYVSDLDGLDEDEITKKCFGIDKTIIPGDSGCPVVNSNFELIGLCYGKYPKDGGLGYVTKIDEFLKYL